MPRLSLTALAITATLTSAVKVGGPYSFMGDYLSDLAAGVNRKELICALCLPAETDTENFYRKFCDPFYEVEVKKGSLEDWCESNVY